VVKTILDNHNGKFLIESEEGKGTKIRVVLPMLVAKNRPVRT
jgi:signal transduction histidine kinase